MGFLAGNIPRGIIQHSPVFNGHQIGPIGHIGRLKGKPGSRRFDRSPPGIVVEGVIPQQSHVRHIAPRRKTLRNRMNQLNMARTRDAANRRNVRHLQRRLAMQSRHRFIAHAIPNQYCYFSFCAH